MLRGLVHIGVFHAVIIDAARGVFVDEAGEVLLKWVDGSWRTDLSKFEGWQFDQVAVTHLPVDPHSMSHPYWLERCERQREKAREAMRKRREDGGSTL